MTFDKQTILNVIPLGRENAISRGKIKELTGYSDRHIRRCISEMVTAGEAAIIGTSSGSGYYLAETATDITDAVTDLNNKVKALADRIVALQIMRLNYAE